MAHPVLTAWTIAVMMTDGSQEEAAGGALTSEEKIGGEVTGGWSNDGQRGT